MGSKREPTATKVRLSDPPVDRKRPSNPRMQELVAGSSFYKYDAEGDKVSRYTSFIPVTEYYTARQLYEQRVEDELATHPTFEYQVRPASGVIPETVEELATRANEYFEVSYAVGQKPKLNGLALHLGCAGPLSLQRLGMRRPEFRSIISRCLTAIADSYEQMLDGGSATAAMFMMRHLPEFDVSEAPGSAPIQYYQDKREITLNAKVSGVADPAVRGKELNPHQAYYRLVHQTEPIEDAELQGEAAAVPMQSLEDILDDESR